MTQLTVTTTPQTRVDLLRPIASAVDVMQAQNETREFLAKALVKGRDYGRIKGTQRDTLYKAGAERTILAFGCFARFVLVEKEVDHDRVVDWEKNYKGGDTKRGTSIGLYRYVYECQVVNRATGEVVGSFQGSASTMESKYLHNPREAENTMVKMAQKRALVGAALCAFGLSDQFTQDLEDTATEDEHESEAKLEPITRETAWPANPAHLKGKPIRELPIAFLQWAIEPGRKLGDRTAEWQKVCDAELVIRADEIASGKKDEKKDELPSTPTEQKAEEPTDVEFELESESETLDEYSVEAGIARNEAAAAKVGL